MAKITRALSGTMDEMISFNVAAGFDDTMLEEAALQLMNEAMRRPDGNQSIASRLLGISQPALSKRLKRLLS